MLDTAEPDVTEVPQSAMFASTWSFMANDYDVTGAAPVAQSSTYRLHVILLNADGTPAGTTTNGPNPVTNDLTFDATDALEVMPENGTALTLQPYSDARPGRFCKWMPWGP